MQSDGLDAGPAQIFLPGAADQAAIHRQRDWFQIIAEEDFFSISKFDQRHVSYFRSVLRTISTASCLTFAIWAWGSDRKLNALLVLSSGRKFSLGYHANSIVEISLKTD